MEVSGAASVPARVPKLLIVKEEVKVDVEVEVDLLLLSL